MNLFRLSEIYPQMMSEEGEGTMGSGLPFFENVPRMAWCYAISALSGGVTGDCYWLQDVYQGDTTQFMIMSGGGQLYHRAPNATILYLSSQPLCIMAKFRLIKGE